MKRAIAIAAAALALLGACNTGARTSGNAPPAGATTVLVASSPEKYTLIKQLADRFNATKTKVDGKTVFVQVQKASSGTAADLLVDDWTDQTSLQRPVIWTPSATIWGSLVDERRLQKGKPKITGDFKPSMLTPAVIAMPKPMVDALGYPARPVGWADIVSLAQNPAGWGQFGHPEWGPFRLGMTDPEISTSGFNSTIAQSYAGVGKQRDLTTADVTSPQETAFLTGVESSVVHYGDTTLTFLQNLYNADKRGAALGYISAVTVEEKSVLDYNKGDPAGNLLPGQTAQKPRTPLVAVYPKEGTLWSDDPFYVLDAPWVTKTQKDAAARFRDFVVNDKQSQETVLSYGFRPSNPAIAVGPPVEAANGVDPAQPQTVLPVPPGSVLQAVLQQWVATRKTAQVLLVLDVSGSMGDQADPGGDTKLDLAKKAVTESLPLFNDRDQVGLWVFSTQLDGQKDWRQLVPVGPMGQNRDQIRNMVSGLEPQNGTGLYDTTDQAVKTMEQQATPDKITAVVLMTDGKNEKDGGLTLDQLVADLQTQGELHKVRVFAIAYGQDASVPQLQQIVDATQGALYQSKDPKDIQKVFANVVSNF